MASTLFFGIIFVVLGAIGGTTAVSRWWRGYIGFRILHMPWGMYYGMGLFFSGLVTIGGIRQLDGGLMLFLAAMLPFALLGGVMWSFAFAMELAAKAAASNNMHVEPTYDVGDGLMVRHQFKEAETAFRKHLREFPADVPALLRVSRAQIADGRVEDAVRELETARRDAIARKDSVEPGREEFLKKIHDKEYRQDRILRLTFALGDIYVEKLSDNARAIALYEESLQVLFGYPPADPLRDRLKALRSPDRLSLPEAVEQAQPLKISLPE